jgi:hypothetical protein
VRQVGQLQQPHHDRARVTQHHPRVPAGQPAADRGERAQRVRVQERRLGQVDLDPARAPADHGVEHGAQQRGGRDVHFTAHLHDLRRPVPAGVDDEVRSSGRRTHVSLLGVRCLDLTTIPLGGGPGGPTA